MPLAQLMPTDVDRWLTPTLQQQHVTRLMGRVGMTRRRAECFVRLWAYLSLKQQGQQRSLPPAPLKTLTLPQGWVSCTCSEAAALFYTDTDRGSERSAGMMLDKLAALGLIQKSFDGNTLNLAIASLPELHPQTSQAQPIGVKTDDFDPRCDAIPIANMLAANYNWMNHNNNAVPYRIAELLRSWASQYSRGMRVLRRCDNLNPIGFYLFYPTSRPSEIHFFGSPHQGLHLSAVREVDLFEMALAGDETCRAVFIRSWMIESAYQESLRPMFLRDAQQTLQRMTEDFPNLCDLHTLIIHPSYEELAQSLGFQKLTHDSQGSVYWMYLALDRFLQLPIVD